MNSRPEGAAAPRASSERPALTFTFQAGALLRGRAKRALMESAWSYGLDIVVDEAKGFLESAYRVRVTGPERAVRAYWAAVREWGRQFDD